MRVTFNNLPSTPDIHYAGLLEESPVCTRKELCQKNPNKCRRMNKSTAMCALRNTAPGRLGRHCMPCMDDSNSHAVSFSHDSDKSDGTLKEASLGRDYFQKKFEMVRVLGCGSFGTVLSMVCKEDRKQCAIKSLSKYQGQSDRNTKWREVAFLEFIDHPNCIQFQGAWEEQDKLYIRTELCKCSLQQYINEVDGNVPEHMVLSVLLDMLIGLSYLHRNRIVHLDIKPENILLTENGIAKLADFGIAFCLDYDDPKDCYVEGDARYLAHEGMDDNSEFRVSTKRDIYSLGVCVLQLATDLSVSSNSGNLELVREFKLPPYVYLRIPRKLNMLLPRMMAENPSDRPEADQILGMKGLNEHAQKRFDFVKQNTTKRRDEELNANWIRQALTQARNKTIEKKQPKRGKVSRPMLLEFD